MLKKYQAKSCISLSVLMKNGNSVRVAFDGLTGGGSVYYTNDEELQAALEKHPKFGKLFKLEQEIAPENKPAKTKTASKAKVAKEAEVKDDNTEAPEGDNAENDTTEEGATDNAEDGAEDEGEETEGEDDGLRVIRVTDEEDAKDYLAENFGISRTKLRGTKAFNDIAASHGIKFVIE